jgi:hypothetical protein
MLEELFPYRDFIRNNHLMVAILHPAIRLTEPLLAAEKPALSHQRPLEPQQAQPRELKRKT